MLLFVLGVLFSAMCCGSSYVCQCLYAKAKDEDQDKMNPFHYISIGLAVLAYLGFLLGGVVAFIALLLACLG